MSEQTFGKGLDRLDELQRNACMADRNCVVTAGAGAGKTTVLASRYVHLVADEGIPVRSILALTFTRKAAAEMYERIYGELAARDSEWAREQLDDFQNSRITTLDSFCAEIVRQAARDFGYSPEFAIDQEKTADLAAGIAQRYVLRNRNAPGVREMLASFPFDDVAARLFGDLGASHVTPLALLSPRFAPMKKTIAALAAEKAGAAYDRLDSAAREIARLSAGMAAPHADCAAAVACAANLLEARNVASAFAFPATPPAPELTAPNRRRVLFEAFAGLALRSYGKAENEQAVKAIVAGDKKCGVKGARDLAADLLDFLAYEKTFPSHCSLLDRLDEYAAELAEAKRLADLMDFKDLGVCAVHVLESRRDIREYWKNGVERIMIDEFQDNNELQKDLLYLLAEKRGASSEGIPSPNELDGKKLFFVGDEKQSIYRFRGADVSVFKTLSRELSGDSASPRTELNLSANYRSSEKLIDFFNALFAMVMAEDGERKEFSARYSEMSPGASAQGAKPFESRIHYYLEEPLDQDEENADAETAGDSGESGDDEDADAGDAAGVESEPLGADDSLAFEIARFIAASRGSLELRAGNGRAPSDGPRLADYGDFAILLRTTANQHRLEKYLRLFGVPFDSGSPRSLFRESPANDLYNILSYAEDAGNRAAYAATLRSPLCRISDEAFLRLMASDEPDFTLEGASPRDAAMLARARAFFAALGEFAAAGLAGDSPAGQAGGRASVPDIVAYVWNYAGLRLDLLSRPEAHRFLEHFDFLYHIAAGVERARGGISDFLAGMRPYIEGETEKLDIEDVPRNAVPGVRILTIHKAKGLQFPIVIVPWVENSGSSRRSHELWEMLPEGLAVDMKPYDVPGARANNIFFRLAKDLEGEKEVAEIKRLLYVACTRAEDHLFFFGKRGKKTDDAGRSFRHYLDAFLAAQAAGAALAERPAPAPSFLECTPLARRTKADIRRLFGRSQKPPVEDFARAYEAAGSLERPFPRLRLTATELNERFLAARGPDDGGRPAAPRIADRAPIPPELFGTLCHDAVESALAAGSTAGYSPPAGMLRGVDEGDAARAAAMAVAMAEGFLRSDFWKSLPREAKKTSEKGFLMSLGNFVIEGRMDFLAETEDEAIVVDFKSDMARDPDRYDAQLALYRRAIEAIAPGKRARIGLFWLRDSAFSWREPDLSDDALLELARAASARVGQTYS